MDAVVADKANRLRSLWLIHPWLLAAAPVLFLLSHNTTAVDADIVLWSLGACLVIASGAFLLALLVLRKPGKASTLASLALLLFFTYGHWFNFLLARHWFDHLRSIHILLSILSAAVFVAGAMLIARTKADLTLVGRILTTVLLVGIISWSYTIFSGHRVVWSRKRMEYQQAAMKRPPPVMQDDPRLPDVYHILLDGYGRQDILQEVYGFNNSNFIDFLRDRGFYVADKSVANYPMTTFSLASTLNMRYLTSEIDQHRKKGMTDRSYFLDIIRDHEVGRMFQSLGYRHVHFGTTFLATETSANADIVYNFSNLLLHREFSTVLLRTTMLRELEPSVVDLHRYTLAKLREIQHIDGPTYTFAHLLMPHMPFVFDRHGNVRSDVPLGLQFVDMTGGWEAKQEYIEQMLYLNDEMEKLVDHLLNTSRHPPIIVIHSDHGTAALHPGKKSTFEQWGPLIHERTGILNAYYVPEPVRQRLYPTITPLNSFRLIFTHGFKLNYPRLKDRSFFSWYDSIYHIREVTQQVLTPAGSTQPAMDESP